MPAEPKAIAEILCMAGIYKKRHYFDLAVRLLRGAIETANEEDINTALLLYNLAEVHSDEGNYLAAGPLYRRSVAIWRKEYPLEAENLLSELGTLIRLKELSEQIKLTYQANRDAA